MWAHDVQCPACQRTFEEQLGGNAPQLRCPACGAQFPRVSAAAVAPPIRSIASAAPDDRSLIAALRQSRWLMLIMIALGILMAVVSIASHLAEPAANPAAAAGGLIGAIIGQLIALIPFYCLYRSSTATFNYISLRRPTDLAAAFVAQSGYWKTYVVLIAIGFGFVAFFVVMAILLG